MRKLALNTRKKLAKKRIADREAFEARILRKRLRGGARPDRDERRERVR